MRRRRPETAATTNPTHTIYPAPPEINSVLVIGKATAGYLVYTASFKFYDSQIYAVAFFTRVISSILFADSFSNFSEILTQAYCKRSVSSQSSTEPSYIAKYNKVKAYQAAFINIINLLGNLLTHTTSGQAYTDLMKLGGSILSFSFPEGNNFSTFGFPFVIPTFFIFSIIGIIYNSIELSKNLHSKGPRQGDAPIFSVINALGKVFLSAFFVGKISNNYSYES